MLVAVCLFASYSQVYNQCLDIRACFKGRHVKTRVMGGDRYNTNCGHSQALHWQANKVQTLNNLEIRDNVV